MSLISNCKPLTEAGTNFSFKQEQINKFEEEVKIFDELIKTLKDFGDIHKSVSTHAQIIPNVKRIKMEKQRVYNYL